MIQLMRKYWWFGRLFASTLILFWGTLVLGVSALFYPVLQHWFKVVGLTEIILCALFIAVVFYLEDAV
ncbi:MAG: hypothetical protein IJ934_03865 [Acetobacter sp.]|nr:hypothetical protein [Acetobacter sp.]